MAVNDAEQAALYLDRCAAGMVPAAVTRAWAARALNVLEWVGDVCDVQYKMSVGAEHPEFPGAQSVQSYTAVGHGYELFGQLAQAVGRRPSARSSSILPAAGCLRTRTAGSKASRSRGLAVSANRGREQGVILTCGGYEYDEEMKLNYLKGWPMYFYGNPGTPATGCGWPRPSAPTSGT